MMLFIYLILLDNLFKSITNNILKKYDSKDQTIKTKSFLD